MIEIGFWNCLLVGGELAGKEKIVWEEKFAMVAHVESRHLMLYFCDTGQTGSFFHHLHDVSALQSLRYCVTILHQLSKANVLYKEIFTLWQMKEYGDFTPVL